MKSTTLIAFIFISTLISCRSEQIPYEQIITFQDNTLPELPIDPQIKNSVLFIFPHPDDEINCAGTMAKMRAAGWKINLLTLTMGSAADSTTRLKEWKAAGNVLGFNRMVYRNFYNNSWNAVLGDSILFWNDHQDEIRSAIASAIQEIHPTILITYDDAIGGYGHPEHRITAHLTHDIFEKGKSDPGFTPRALYQITLTDAMEHFMLSGETAYELEMQRTGTSGLPSPDEAVTITDYWGVKKAAGDCYVSQRDILTKFYLLPPKNQSEEHFRAFSREYYVLIKP